MRLLFSILATLLSLFYFLPFALAFNKRRANTAAIIALNLFLGWSLIDWVVAVVWALKEESVYFRATYMTILTLRMLRI